MYKQISANKRKTWFLIIVFTIIVLLIGWAFGEYTGSGYGVLVIAGIVAVAMTLTSYFSGDKLALASAGAKGPIQKADNPYVYRMVENLSITAGIPMPKVYIINDSALNAFATGRDPEHASVAVTTGIVEALENEELEGVIAHELSHIKNFDIRLMMIVLVLVGVVVLLSDIFWRWSFFGGSRRSNRQGGGVMMVIGLISLIVAPIVAQIIKLAISRKREFLADASGALLTRYPEGLARALEKISRSKPMKKSSNATAHLFISNPFGAKSRKGLARMFSTHPPVEERIQALRAIG